MSTPVETILLDKGPKDGEPPVNNDCDCDCKAPAVNLSLASCVAEDISPAQFEQCDCKSAGGAIQVDSLFNESAPSEIPVKLTPTIIFVLQLYAQQ